MNSTEGSASNNGLGAIPVVNVEVDDRDFSYAMLLLQIPGGDGNIGEQAEPHGPVHLGVMPRAGGKPQSARLHSAGDHRITGLQQRADSQERDVEAVLADGCIALVEHAAAEVGDMADMVDVLCGWTSRSHFSSAGPGSGSSSSLAGDRREWPKIEMEVGEEIGRIDQPRLAHRGGNGADPIWALGMRGTGYVVDKVRTGDESGHLYLSVVSGQLSVVRCPLSVVSGQWSVVSRSRRLPFHCPATNHDRRLTTDY